VVSQKQGRNPLLNFCAVFAYPSFDAKTANIFDFIFLKLTQVLILMSKFFSGAPTVMVRRFYALKY
jgi:hypothetical protein